MKKSVISLLTLLSVLAIGSFGVAYAVTHTAGEGIDLDTNQEPTPEPDRDNDGSIDTDPDVGGTSDTDTTDPDTDEVPEAAPQTGFGTL
jgi:hypothetical protein